MTRRYYPRFGSLSCAVIQHIALRGRPRSESAIAEYHGVDEEDVAKAFKTAIRRGIVVKTMKPVVVMQPVYSLVRGAEDKLDGDVRAGFELRRAQQKKLPKL